MVTYYGNILTDEVVEDFVYKGFIHNLLFDKVLFEAGTGKDWSA